jgi:mRNA interferase HigB
VRIISKRRLREFWAVHPDAEVPLRYWYTITKARRWQSLAEIRRDFPHADAVETLTVFNVAGNKYRLITDIVFQVQIVYVKRVLTHADYSKGRWK